MPSSTSRSLFIHIGLIATIGIGGAHGSLSYAADGAIDPAFNAGGVGPNSDVLAVAMQSDGKIVIGGFFTSYNGDPSASDRVLRLNADGTRDTSFNAGGLGADTTVYALALQADGKILIGGQFTAYNGDAAASNYVMRLNADGTRDTTFNAGGTGGNDYEWAFAVQPDGKIVVGGNSFLYNGSPVSGRVMRLNNDGTPDPAFNPGGLGAGGSVSAVALQPDGKIVIGGLFMNYNGDAAANDFVMRLNADGTRDTTFNPAGTGADKWVKAIALQSDGKIVIGGEFTAYNGDSGVSDKVMRLNADGTRDTSFDAGGAGADAMVESVAVQPDGKIVVGGSFTTYNGDAGASNYVMRLNADGKPDTTFNSGGAGASALVYAIAVQSDGKLVIGGQFTGYNGIAGSAHVARLLSTAGPACSGAPGSLIAWWPGEGLAQDTVGHYDGTLQNGVTFGTGLVGQAFSFDGVDDAVVVNDTPALNPTSITVEAWIKPDSAPMGTLRDVVTKWGFDATIDSYFLGLINTTGVVKVQGAIGDGATGDPGVSGGSVPLNVWSHIAMTYDAASGLNRVYLNGVAVGERVRAHGIYRTTSRVFIGREDSGNNRYFSGLIDEPAIYGRALTDAEILAIYNAGSNGKCGSSTSGTHPKITVVPGFARQQGSAAATSLIGSVQDAETAAGDLTVTVTSAPAGISITNIVNTGGAITADISTGCNAATGDNTVVLQVSDGSLTANGNLIVSVTANPGPTLTYVSARSVAQGRPLAIKPAAGPSDNGSIASILVQSQGTYAGAIGVDNATGVVSFEKTTPVGTHAITIRAIDNCAAFSDATFALTVTGNGISTDTLLSLRPATSVYGQPVTLTANVTPATGGGGAPTGTVQFYSDGAPLGGPQNLTGAGVELKTNSSTVGTHLITAAYSGDGGFNASRSKSATQQVSTANTSTRISASPSPSYFPLAVTFQANVTAVAPGGGTPTGTVMFMDGRRVLATVPVAAGQASFTTSSLTAGTHTIVASYRADPSYNGSFKSTSHQVLQASLTSGFILPSNGGSIQISVTRTAGELTGNLTYVRGTSVFYGTKVISLVIDGQMATIEGFSSDGELFVAKAYDGGPGPWDRFQLWIEGAEKTAGGGLRGGDVIVSPWGPDTRLKGWVDLHTHPMSNLAFGGKLFHGAPDAGSLMPAVQMPWDPVCRFDNRALNIYDALSQDGPTHGPPLVPPLGWNPCGNIARFGVILALEIANDGHVSPVPGVGYPSFTDWPKWDDITHQKMWIDWIRRDWEGGLRVMVALSHNNRMLAEVVSVAGGGPISGVTNDKASSDLQVEEIKKLVAAHPDFMAIARSSAELQSIVQGGRLAVVLGVEIDNIGDFNSKGEVTEQMVDDEITRLYDQGVRYIFPIHLTDNVFGDTAIYKVLFDAANFRETGKPWKVGCGQVADEVSFRSVGFPPELDPLIPPGTPDPPRAPDCVTATPNGPMFTGHVNVRTEDGLTPLGKFALKAMMKRGMIIDIDHMSDRAANWALGFANFPGGGYPLMSGHTGIRDRHSGDLNAENARTKEQLAQVVCLGGMLGLGTDGMAAFHWAAAYNEAYDDMRRAFAPGHRCQEFTPLGMSFIGLGTDMNSLVRTPPPTMVDTFGQAPRFADIYNPNNPINAGLPRLFPSTTGNKTWDYNFAGVAHYGMYVDFLRDVRTCSGDPTNSCKQIVDDELGHSAENFYRMWLKAETQKVRVP